MRILALTNLYPSPVFPTRGPFNRHTLRLLAQRHAIRLIVPVAWTDEWAAKRRGSLKFPAPRREIVDGIGVEYPRYFFPPRILRSWHGRFFMASVRRAFHRAVQEFVPDVALGCWAYPDGWTVSRLARSCRLPVVIKVHGSDVKLLAQYPSRLRPTVDALRTADRVVVVSKDLAEEVGKLGVDPRRVQVVYNGVDATVFYPGSKADARARLKVEGTAPLIVYVGNLFPVKGIDVLMRAVATLDGIAADARLVVIGQGYLRANLERQADLLRIAHRVNFLGPLPQERLADWYRAADLFVLPSRSEGVPNVLLEAAACGCPWVASGVGGIPEISHIGQSTLVPPDDPSGLSSGIQSALRRPHNPLISARSWDATVDELEAVLQGTYTNPLPRTCDG